MTPTGDYRPRDWADEPIDIPLVDDLANVLARTVVGWEHMLGVDLAQHPEVQRVMARYRRDRQPDAPAPAAVR